MKRVFGWVLLLIARPLFWMFRPKMPEHPAGSASGPLSANAEYLAIYAEGSPAPVAVAIMRYRTNKWPLVRTSGMSSSLHAKGDRSPRSTTITQDDVRIELLYGDDRRTMQLAGHEIDLAEANLVFCEVGHDGQVAAETVKALRTTLPDVRHPVHAEEALLAIAEIQAFVKPEASSGRSANSSE